LAFLLELGGSDGILYYWIGFYDDSRTTFRYETLQFCYEMLRFLNLICGFFLWSFGYYCLMIPNIRQATWGAVRPASRWFNCWSSPAGASLPRRKTNSYVWFDRFVYGGFLMIDFLMYEWRWFYRWRWSFKWISNSFFLFFLFLTSATAKAEEFSSTKLHSSLPFCFEKTAGASTAP